MISSKRVEHYQDNIERDETSAGMESKNLMIFKSEVVPKKSVKC